MAPPPVRSEKVEMKEVLIKKNWYGVSSGKVLENIKDAIHLHIEDRIESGEEIQQTESVSLTLMEVAV